MMLGRVGILFRSEFLTRRPLYCSLVVVNGNAKYGESEYVEAVTGTISLWDGVVVFPFSM